MHNPPHPGEILREGWLVPLGVTVTAAADALGIARKTLSKILNGHAGISAEMAVRLSIALNTTAATWMHQQVQYDLWQAERRRHALGVTRLSAA
jgi:addiction module HigA family antidote